MASRVKSLAKSSTVSADPNAVVVLRLDEVFADHTWNSRTAVTVDSTDESGNGSRGWYGNLFSIARDGQRDAVTVRPNPAYGREKGAKPYLLVTGFGRYQIMQALASGEYVSDLTNPTKGGLTQAQALALKTSTPTIKAIVKDLTEAQARAENLGENVQRDSLSGPDLAVGVMRLRDADPTLSDAQVAVMLNKNQPFVSKIKRIAEGLRNTKLPAGWNGKDSPAMSILDAWRTDQCKVTQDDMLAIASEKDESKKAKLYADKRVQKASKEGKAKTGKGALIPNIINVDLPIVATMLVKLIRLGVIEVHGTFDSKESLTALLSVKRGTLPDLTEEQVDTLSGALETAIEKATAEVKAAAKAAGKAAAAAPPKDAAPAAPPKGAKGKGAAVNGARA